MLSVDGVLGSIVGTSAAKDAGSFLATFADAIKQAAGADAVYCKNFFKKSDRPSQGEEFVLNTGKPYLDNSLSSYSAFPELINYFNAGFRSCMIIPIKASESEFGIITLLSKKDTFFQEDDVHRIGLLGRFAAQEYEMMDKADSARKFSGYFDATFESIMPQCIIDRQGSIIKANKSFEGIVESAGQSGREFSGIFGLDRNAMDALKTGKPVDAVINSGNRRFKLYTTRAGEGVFNVLIYEVTELETLREREEFFRYGVGDVFLTLDDKSKIKWVSDNVKTVFRIDGDYLVGKKLVDILKDRDGFPSISVIDAKPRYADIEILLNNDISVKAKCTVMRRTGGFLVILSKNVDTQVAVLKRDIEDMMHLTGDMIITVDGLGYIRNMNKTAEKILKYRGDELRGMSIASICADAESQRRISSSLNLARKNGVVTEVFANLIMKNGSNPMPSQQNVRAVYDDANKISGYMFIGKELATKRLLEHIQESYEKIEKERGMFEEESKGKTQFISSMAHDLRTPITSISGFAKLMLEGQPFGDLNDKQKESLQTIIDESERLNELIEHILDAAKLEAGKVKLDFQMVDMRELGQNAGIRSVAEMVTNKGLVFDYSVDYDVPEIECDPNRIVQVLVNLIGNANKFTEKGSIKVLVKRNGKGKKVKRVRIEVKDTGIGVSKEDRAKLFRKFFQIERNDLVMKVGKGTGLGLTIVKEIVGLHKGSAGVESEFGKGSIFWFTLPIKQRVKDPSNDSSFKTG